MKKLLIISLSCLVTIGNICAMPATGILRSARRTLAHVHASTAPQPARAPAPVPAPAPAPVPAPAPALPAPAPAPLCRSRQIAPLVIATAAFAAANETLGAYYGAGSGVIAFCAAKQVPYEAIEAKIKETTSKACATGKRLATSLWERCKRTATTNYLGVPEDATRLRRVAPAVIALAFACSTIDPEIPALLIAIPIKALISYPLVGVLTKVALVVTGYE